MSSSLSFLFLVFIIYYDCKKKASSDRGTEREYGIKESILRRVIEGRNKFNKIYSKSKLGKNKINKLEDSINKSILKRAELEKDINKLDKNNLLINPIVENNLKKRIPEKLIL